MHTGIQSAVTKGRLVRLGVGVTVIDGRIATKFTVPKGRGNVMGFEIFVLNNTIASVDGLFVGVSMNGTEVLEDAAGLQYTPQMSGGSHKNFTPQIMMDSSTFQLILTGDAGAVGVIVRIELIFDCEHNRRKYGMINDMPPMAA